MFGREGPLCCPGARGVDWLWSGSPAVLAGPGVGGGFLNAAGLDQSRNGKSAVQWARKANRFVRAGGFAGIVEKAWVCHRWRHTRAGVYTKKSSRKKKKRRKRSSANR